MAMANSSRHSQTSTGTVNQRAPEPSHSIDDGRSKNVWPPEMPVSRPRSTMSMPRVTMKPLSR